MRPCLDKTTKQKTWNLIYLTRTILWSWITLVFYITYGKVHYTNTRSMFKVYIIFFLNRLIISYHKENFKFLSIAEQNLVATCHRQNTKLTHNLNHFNEVIMIQNPKKKKKNKNQKEKSLTLLASSFLPAAVCI